MNHDQSQTDVINVILFDSMRTFIKQTTKNQKPDMYFVTDAQIHLCLIACPLVKFCPECMMFYCNFPIVVILGSLDTPVGSSDKNLENCGCLLQG